MFDKQRKTAGKAMYSTLGAPVVARRLAQEYAARFTKFSDRLIEQAHVHYEESAEEGKKIAERFQDGNVVEEIQTRVDMDRVQDRVGKLRDQLDAALEGWRENFAPDDAKEAPKKVAVEEPASASKTAKSTKAASETTTTKKTPAKTTGAKATTTKKTPAKTTAAKKTTAKTAAAKKTTAKKTPAKPTTAKSSTTKSSAKTTSASTKS